MSSNCEAISISNKSLGLAAEGSELVQLRHGVRGASTVTLTDWTCSYHASSDSLKFSKVVSGSLVLIRASGQFSTDATDSGRVQHLNGAIDLVTDAFETAKTRLALARL